MTVDFDFSPEQRALRDMARDVFEKESPPSRLREIWNGGDRDPRVWKMLAEVGILGAAVPEAHGGFGGSAVDLALVLEEAGRAALPEPLLETALVATAIIAGSGNDDLKSEWLERIAGGGAVVTLLPESSPFCVDADIADLVLVQRGDDVHAHRSFTFAPARSLDLSRRLFTVTTAPGVAIPGAGGRLRALAALGAACVLNGVGLRLVEMTRDYVATRKQFGKPVGSFQAVAHKVADMHVALEPARAAAWYAAYADAAALPDAFTAAAVAKAAAGEAARVVNRDALQCHGGIGFTWEHDLHLWLKRGIALEHAYGSARDHRTALAAELFDA